MKKTNNKNRREEKPRWPLPPGWTRAKEIAWVEEYKKIFPTLLVKYHKQCMAERIAKTRKLFGRKLLIGDVHSHTVFSDGTSTIEEMKEMADLAGLDFIFITDHRTIRQKHHCNIKEGLWWGQEPPSRIREIGVLNSHKLFVPGTENLAKDWEKAKKCAPFAFIPHPVGYRPRTTYPQEIIDDLWTIGDRFSMEVMNGAFTLTRAFDSFAEKYVKFWDKLLAKGKQVNALAGSDAHHCHIVGVCWTGVYCGRKHPDAVVRALNKGHSFASEAPLLRLSCGGALMGEEVKKKRGTRVRIRFTAADSIGLHSVRLVKDGKVVRRISATDKSKVSGDYEFVARSKHSYVRLECTASDQRRALSSPIYILSG